MLERSSLGGRARPAKKSKPWKRLEFAWLNLPPQLVRQLPQLWELRYEHQFNHRFSIGSWMINDLGRVGRGLYRLRKIHSGRFWEGKGTTSVVPISSFPSTLRAREESAFPSFSAACFSRAVSIREIYRAAPSRPLVRLPHGLSIIIYYNQGRRPYYEDSAAHSDNC